MKDSWRLLVAAAMLAMSSIPPADYLNLKDAQGYLRLPIKNWKCLQNLHEICNPSFQNIDSFGLLWKVY